eukprot:scaffold37469_cov20-Tisochrysis_lutea.AAC.1
MMPLTRGGAHRGVALWSKPNVSQVPISRTDLDLKGPLKLSSPDGMGQALETQQDIIIVVKLRFSQAQDEAKELAAEYALLRKVKSGRMSERAYEVATGLAAASSGSGDDVDDDGSLEE